MAIIVEEGEKKSNLLGIIGWLIFLGVAAAAIYYIFFTQPQLVAIQGNGNLDAIAPITQEAASPTTVMQSAAFMALKSTIALPSPQGPAGVGRANPLVAP
jgi:hypothetical protein